MDSLETAARAFDAIDNGRPAPSEPARRAPQMEMADLFGDVGSLEIDDESPAQGGGDNMPIKGEKRAKAQEEELFDEGDSELDPDGLDDPDEGEGDPEEEAPEDEDDEEDELANQMFEVVVDGEPKQVSLREALDGYIRQDTFHQRLNELNEHKTVLSNEAGKLLEDRRKYMSMIDDLQTLTNQLIPKEPDWDAEYARDPVAARKLQKQYEQIKATKAGLDAEKARVAKEQKDEDDAQFLEYRRNENKRLLQVYPHWGGKNGEEKMRADLTMMADTLRNTGFTSEEIQSIYDSRMVRIAMKAARYDRMMANKIKPIKQGSTKPMNSGAGRRVNGTAPKGDRRASEQLRKTGSIEAAASVFDAIISKPKKRR